MSQLETIFRDRGRGARDAADAGRRHRRRLADHAADSSLLAIAEQTAASAEKSVRLTRVRLEGGVAPRTDLRQAEQILSTAQADLARQRTAVAQDVNALQLLVGAPIDPDLLPARSTKRSGRSRRSGRARFLRPAAPSRRGAGGISAARRQCADRRRARRLVPAHHADRLARLCQQRADQLFTGGAFGWSAGADASYTIFQAGAGRANVRLSEAERDAAVATYQQAIQTAFREVSDALARRGTINDEIAARQRQQVATADTYTLTEARYRAGIDPFLTVLDAQRSYYSAQQTMVQTKLTAAQNIVDLYQAIGGDASLQAAPVCQSLPGDNNSGNNGATISGKCRLVPATRHRRAIE